MGDEAEALDIWTEEDVDEYLGIFPEIRRRKPACPICGKRRANVDAHIEAVHGGVKAGEEGRGH